MVEAIPRFEVNGSWSAFHRRGWVAGRAIGHRPGPYVGHIEMVAMGAESLLPAIIVGPLPDHLIPSFHRALDVVARERLYLTFLEAPPLEETRDFILGGRVKGDLRLVAVVAGDVVGWCDISRNDPPAKAHRGMLGTGIIPMFRGQGLGRRLVASALEQAWAAGLTRVELTVRTDNARAIALYDRLGFDREGLIRDALRIDGAYRDAFAMAVLRRPVPDTLER